jgi:hypothetical protein
MLSNLKLTNIHSFLFFQTHPYINPKFLNLGIFHSHNKISKIMDINEKFITINPNHNTIILFFLKNDFTKKQNPRKFTFNLNISNKEKERARGWEREDLPSVEDEGFSLVTGVEDGGRGEERDKGWEKIEGKIRR